MQNKYISRALNFFQYLGATLFVALIQIAANPLLAKNLSPEDYAIIGYYSSFNILFTPFITFFMTNFFIKRYFQVTLDEREVIKSTVLKSLISFSLLLSLVALGCLFIYHNYFNNDSSLAFSPYAFLTIFSIPLTGIYSLKLSELRLKRDAGSFAKFSILTGILSVGIALLFVVILKAGAEGRLLATLIANLIVFVIVFIGERQIILKGKFDKQVFRELFQFCWPLTIAGMLGFFSNGIDKVLLERQNNVRELGIYSVAAQIASYLTIFSNAVNATFQPDVYECYAKKEFKKLFKYIGLIVGTIAIAVFCYIALAPWIIDLLTAGVYVESAYYSRIIALSSITAAIYYSSSQISIAMGYSKLLLYVKLLGSAISVIVCYKMIQIWGFTGAAYSCVLANLVFFIINILFLYIFKRDDLINEK